MRNFFGSMQWAFFILANIVVIPVSVGYAFGLSLPEIATLLQRTFFVIGVTSLLQGLFGHKLPLNESPAGLWWSLFLIYAGVVGAGDAEASTVLRSLEMGILIAGILIILLSVFRLMEPIKKLFTPLVTGTYMILLVSQLAGPFTEGILGIGYLTEGFDGKVAVLSLVILIFAVVLAKSRSAIFSSYSVLFSLAFGWILFAIFGVTKPLDVGTTSWISVPMPFAWGSPTFDLGIVIVSIFTTFLLLTNLVASADVVSKVVGQKEKVDYNRSGFVMGINHMIAACFSVVGSVPIAAVAGFISTTKVKEKLPYIIGSAAILVMSFFPVIMTFLASLPVPVGYATLFLSISSLAGIGINALRNTLDDVHSPSIISLSLMAGFGLMAVPDAALKHLPDALTSLISNGLVVGVIICITLEQIFKATQRKQANKQEENQAGA